jgi:rhodanese-related sulfurtransferase
MRHQRQVKDSLYGHFARIGSALANPKRLEIIELLSQAERSVEDIAAAAALTLGNASAHLKVLYGARLVDRRREGQRIFYRLASPGVFRLLRGLEQLGEEQLAEVERLVRQFYQDPGELEPVTAGELLRRLREDDVFLLDVRPPAEYQAGHLPGALNLPPDELAQRLGELPRDKEIVAYCRGRYCLFSTEAVALLRRHGFRARRMAGGLPDWRAEGHPVAVGTE